jgi:hypothetical protein
MKYRAQLFDPGTQLERPVQIFGNSLKDLHDWAEKVLKDAVADNAAVHFYEQAEKPAGIIQKQVKGHRPSGIINAEPHGPF